MTLVFVCFLTAAICRALSLIAMPPIDLGLFGHRSAWMASVTSWLLVVLFKPDYFGTFCPLSLFVSFWYGTVILIAVCSLTAAICRALGFISLFFNRPVILIVNCCTPTDHWLLSVIFHKKWAPSRMCRRHTDESIRYHYQFTNTTRRKKVRILF